MPHFPFIHHRHFSCSEHIGVFLSLFFSHSHPFSPTCHTLPFFPHTLGPRRASRMLMLGTLLSPADALDVGLVDELVPSTAALTSAATYRMRTLLDVNDGARRSTKEMLRREAADALVSRISEDTNDFVRMVSSESVQGEIKAYLELLKEKNKAN